MYFNRMYPNPCKGDRVSVRYVVFVNGVLMGDRTAGDGDYYSWINKVWPAGNITVFAKGTWSKNKTNDFGVRAYFNQTFTFKKTTFKTDQAA